MKRMLFVLTLVAILALPVMGVAAKPGATWNVPGDFATVQEAIDSLSVADGDTILVGPSNHAGALVSKAVTIKGTGGAVIDTGPMHPAGLSMGFRLLAGSDGATISHLQFDVDLAIMNGDAVDDVTVEHCTFLNAIQAVSNWRGSGWDISHNKITDLRTRSGGGIGILIGDYSGGTVSDNVVAHNDIQGTLHVASNDCGEYDGSGIVLYADFRGGGAGADEITDNRVVKNRISLASDTPDVVDVVAFELTEGYYPDPHPGPPYVVTSNYIGFNDFRGTAQQIALSPPALEDLNTLSRNLGDNRGHGEHPSLFGPGH